MDVTCWGKKLGWGGGGGVGGKIIIDGGLVPREGLFVYGRLLKATDNEVGTFPVNSLDFRPLNGK